MNEVRLINNVKTQAKIPLCLLHHQEKVGGALHQFDRSATEMEKGVGQPYFDLQSVAIHTAKLMSYITYHEREIRLHCLCEQQ